MFGEISYKSFTIFAKRSVLDVWQGSEYVSGLRIEHVNFCNWIKLSNQNLQKLCVFFWEVHLGPCQTFMMERFCKKDLAVKIRKMFLQKISTF